MMPPTRFGKIQKKNKIAVSLFLNFSLPQTCTRKTISRTFSIEGASDVQGTVPAVARRRLLTTAIIKPLNKIPTAWLDASQTPMEQTRDKYVSLYPLTTITWIWISTLVFKGGGIEPSDVILCIWEMFYQTLSLRQIWLVLNSGSSLTVAHILITREKHPVRV